MSVANFLFKWTLRILQPKAAKRMEQDGSLSLPNVSGPLPENLEWFYIDDNGADLTVFAYSGLDSLFAGRARYEFRTLFRSLDVPCNLVCIRDPRISCFHVAYDGKGAGLDFYAQETKKIMDQLGSTYNVALGSSSGGEAAFAFGTLCGMSKIVAFSPAFPHSVYRAPLNVVKSLFNVPNLVTNPQAYIETLIVTVATIWMEDVVSHHAKGNADFEFWDTYSLYKNAGDERPPATVFYGRKSGPDARQARLLAEFPEIKTVALDTARHNCPAVLLKRRELYATLSAELRLSDDSAHPVPEESQEAR